MQDILPFTLITAQIARRRKSARTTSLPVLMGALGHSGSMAILPPWARITPTMRRVLILMLSRWPSRSSTRSKDAHGTLQICLITKGVQPCRRIILKLRLTQRAQLTRRVKQILHGVLSSYWARE